MKERVKKPFVDSMDNTICSLYVIYDSVSGIYGDIFQAANDAAVKRQFTNIFKNSRGKVPVADLTVVRLAQVVSSDSPDDVWPIICNMNDPVFVLKGCDIDYDEEDQSFDSAHSDHSVSETV